MKRAIITLIFFVVIGAGFIFFWQDIFNFFESVNLNKEAVNIGIKELQKKIFETPVLKFGQDDPLSFLTADGVVRWTNEERRKNGLPPLLENSLLDKSAELKAKDMLKRQYFAHQSPTGAGVSDLAKSAGYEFIIIGENLALGDFKDDNALVTAWMNSPGHRANILNSQYTEIGVSVIKGEFEGKNTWLAVQHFGFPLSACSEPSMVLKRDIELAQGKSQQLQAEIDKLGQEIKSFGPKWRSDYRAKADEYNQSVSQYNALIQEVRSLINKYNEGVEEFNKCAGASS